MREDWYDRVGSDVHDGVCDVRELTLEWLERGCSFPYLAPVWLGKVWCG